LKFEIAISRTVQVKQYETLKIQYVAEFDDGNTCPDVAEREVSDKVNEWVKLELDSLNGRRK
jgi:hypothetical protein